MRALSAPAAAGPSLLRVASAPLRVNFAREPVRLLASDGGNWAGGLATLSSEGIAPRSMGLRADEVRRQLGACR